MSPSSLGSRSGSPRLLSLVLSSLPGPLHPSLLWGEARYTIPFSPPGVLLLHVPTGHGFALGGPFRDSWALKFARRPSPHLPQHIGPLCCPGPPRLCQGCWPWLLPCPVQLGKRLGGRILGEGSLRGPISGQQDLPTSGGHPGPTDFLGSPGLSVQPLLQAWRLCPQDAVQHSRDHWAPRVFPQPSLHLLWDRWSPRLAGTSPALGLFFPDGVCAGFAVAQTPSVPPCLQAALSARVLHCPDPSPQVPWPRRIWNLQG